MHIEKIGEVQISVKAIEEDTPVRGNAMASGDKIYDKKVEDKILKELRGGNQHPNAVLKATKKAGFTLLFNF
ncbi:hypothetical protein OsccyDRAFT_0615 [Leptolyngbyaceae cyanobacterium JSC-12]|nr:hypothetical protein OsccyDRAFT_0615 [Leptolyngbyaceae cyanobacterium JSC-12]